MVCRWVLLLVWASVREDEYSMRKGERVMCEAMRFL